MTKRAMNYCVSSLLFLLVLSSSSCKKQFNGDVSLNSNTKDLPPPPLTWEGQQYLPTSPANVVSFPWYGNVGGINVNIATDYKSTDGWVMIFNTFSSSASPYLATQPPGGLYFALYNKYRGVLRFYLYLPPGMAQPTSSITQGLSVNSTGATSSMLNFENSDIVDANARTQAVSKVNNQQVAALGNWVVADYQIAYDPNIASTSYPNFGLTWSAKAVNVTTIDITGTQTGTLTGSITTPSSGFDWSGVLAPVVPGAIEIKGISDLAGISKTGTSGTTYSALQGAIGSALGNSISGFLSAITGGNSNNTQEVDLTMNSQIQLQGTLVNNFLLTAPNFVVPNQSNATTAYGPNPAYTSPLGVFNLPSRPIVYCHTTEADYSLVGSDRPYSGSKDVFTIDPNFLTVLGQNENPAVLSIANISVYKTSILLLPTTTSGIRSGGIFGGSFQGYETIGSNKYISNPTYIDQMSLPSSGYQGTAYIRVTLQVTPNSTSYTGQPILLTKTFLANVIPN